MLQWSHGRLTVVTSSNVALFASVQTASMEPRSFNRGDVILDGDNVECVFASMEPRSFNRGDSYRFVQFDFGVYASMEPRSFNRGDTTTTSR